MTAHDCQHGQQLAQLLDADDVDAALEAGLMAFVPCPACATHAAMKIAETQKRLIQAWAARDRYRAREARLQRIATERAAKRAAHARKSSLPPIAATILARAKAKAAARITPA
jgi:hypothetical protein